MLGGLVALALLGLGEAAPAAFPVRVAIQARGAEVAVLVDGQAHTLVSALGGGWQAIAFEQPGPFEREYQIDGSDLTSTHDRDVAVIERWLDTPLYRVDAWLRDEPSYSRWLNPSVVDLATGQPVPPGAAPPDSFRIDAALERPEATARLWLIGASPDQREGLELDRDRRNARWIVQRGGGFEALPRWFFPERPLPFAAELVHLLGRSAAAGWALVAVALALGRGVELVKVASVDPVGRSRAWIGRVSSGRLISGRVVASSSGRVVGEALLAVWLVAAALVTIRLYHQAPHILDAVSYTFQAGLLAAGRLWLAPPAAVEDLKGPFQVIFDQRWFSQYPPGAPAAYALGRLLGLQWLVGPLACLALIGASSWAAGNLFGRNVGLLALALGTVSPFILFQAGSFLSHPIAGGLLAGALAAVVAGERFRALHWYALAGALLGCAFLTREAASVLFAAPLVARSLRRPPALVWLCVAGLPFLGVYLAYNAALTGNPLQLPRNLFDPSDHFGFGDGVGFHARHTLAAGLANADELLTILQFDLFGWPPVFSFGLLLVPFLLGAAGEWEWYAAAGFGLFVVTYVGYFYHGVALGPRYYFEAVPWLLILAARGAAVVAEVVGSRVAVLAVLGLLCGYGLGFYLPAEVARRVDYSGLPDARPLAPAFVETSLGGPRLTGVAAPALVLADDWWIYNAVLASLNCPSVPACPVVFGLATNATEAARLERAYPGRRVLRAIEDGDRLLVQP